MTIGKVLRALGGLIVLLILVLTVNNWWTDYRKATPKRGETTATVTATPTAAPAAANSTVSVLVDGLNFRVKPDATGKSLRGLKKGEKLTLVSQAGSWLQLKDAAGKVGWVTNNPQYLRIDKKK